MLELSLVDKSVTYCRASVSPNIQACDGRRGFRAKCPQRLPAHLPCLRGRSQQTRSNAFPQDRSIDPKVLEPQPFSTRRKITRKTSFLPETAQDKSSQGTTGSQQLACGLLGAQEILTDGNTRAKVICYPSRCCTRPDAPPFTCAVKREHALT